MTDRSADYFRIFFEASQTVLSAQSLQETLKLLVKRSVQALGAKAGSLRLVDEKTNRLELVASHLLSKKYLSKGPLHLDKSIPEVLGKKTIVVQNACDDPRIEYREEKRAEGINTILSVPVIAKDKVIGILRLYTKQPRDFTDHEIEFVSALAEMGGLAIANAKIYEDEGIELSSLLQDVGVELPTQGPRRKQRFRSFAMKPTEPTKSIEEFRALHQVTTAILANLNSNEAMSLIVGTVIDMMAVKGCSLFIVNETTGELGLMASRGLSDDYLGKGSLHMNQSIQETLSGAPVLIRDIKTDERVEYPEQAAREGIASILSIPIIARERVIGVLRLYAAQVGEYTQDDVVFLSALAEIAGITIMNARIYERTKYDLSFWQATIGYLDSSSSEEG